METPVCWMAQFRDPDGNKLVDPSAKKMTNSISKESGKQEIIFLFVPAFLLSLDMSVLVDKDTRLVVQGITGSAGGFHARQCMEYGTNVVAGVTPGKGGQKFDDKVPVFDTVWEAKQKTNCNVSVIFVPAPSRPIPFSRRLMRISIWWFASPKEFQ